MNSCSPVFTGEREIDPFHGRETEDGRASLSATPGEELLAGRGNEEGGREEDVDRALDVERADEEDRKEANTFGGVRTGVAGKDCGNGSTTSLENKLRTESAVR
jgi:hypothetical protein